MSAKPLPENKPLIRKFGDPLVPHLLFEWHENTKKVWCVEIPGRYEGRQFVASVTDLKAKATVIAEHEETHAGAFGAVQTFLRGYKACMTHQALGDYNLSESDLAARAEELAAKLFKGDKTNVVKVG